MPSIVDRLVGADFETPKNIMDIMSEDNHIKNAEYIHYNKEHNILQYWEDNETKNCINNGLVPLSQEEINILGEMLNE